MDVVQAQLLEHNRKVSQTLPSFLHFCHPETKNCSNASIAQPHRRGPGDFMPIVVHGEVTPVRMWSKVYMCMASCFINHAMIMGLLSKIFPLYGQKC